MGIAGVMYSSPIQAFSRIFDDRIRKHPRAIIETGRKLTQLLDNMEIPVISIADPEETRSSRFLESLGFNYMMTTSQGEIYQRWPIKQQTS